MKKIISLLITLGIVLTSFTALAQNEVTVLKDGEKLEFDVNPFIDVDTTMVPMCGIFEAIGADVTWDNDTRTVIALYNVGEEQKSLILQIGCDYAFLNGIKISFEKPAVIVGDRTFVPLRAVNESLGHDVSWDQDTYTVTITTK